MTAKTNSNDSTLTGLNAIKFIVILNGVMGVLPGLALLLTPTWFYQLADFAPYNQHFMGDAGAFSLTVGAMLLVAARTPIQFRNIIGLGALGNLLHVANHIYNDAAVQGWATPHLFTNTLPLAILALLLLWAYFRLGQLKGS